MAAALTLTVTAGAHHTRVPVTTQASPGPTGLKTFDYIEMPVQTHRGPEIDALALRSKRALYAFLRALVREDDRESPVWILEPRLPRLRELLEIGPDATTSAIEV